MYKKVTKRLLDITISFLVLTVFCWLFGILWLLVRIKLGGPAIFTQERPGLIDPKTNKEKIFKLYKFRSMTNARDENGNLLPDEVRLTPFGKRLRETSLDELPEFWNILKGDMSFIGPRPLLVKYLPYYSDEERLRHSVRPGLTGYAQAHGRNTICWEQKFEYDLYYVRNLSFALDVRIVIDTIKAVFTHEGIVLNALEDFDEYRKHSNPDT